MADPNSLPIATLVAEYNQHITKLTSDLVVAQAQIKHITSLLEAEQAEGDAPSPKED